VLQYNSAHLNARLLLLEYDLKQGENEKAKAEMHIIRQLKPPNLAELERWYVDRGGK
jgi:hypothetical protein